MEVMITSLVIQHLYFSGESTIICKRITIKAWGMTEDKINSPPDDAINIEVMWALFADLKSNNHS
jgi:hypothetical protein